MKPYNTGFRPVELRTPQEFAWIDGREWTTWKLFDGRTMAGKLVDVMSDRFCVQRVDGTTCHVPKEVCRPATCEDIEAAIRTFA